ncbi:MAG: hypothetical protein JSV86_09755 [Gemmatimonadota bacterium]|nr:MAG: hypothetical protein JSV86_09755 [Gemmatimonadota bacterium]
MGIGFAVLLLFAMTFGLAVLPLLPAIMEWRLPKDTSPLRVVRESEVDIRFLAHGFQAYVDSAFGALLADRRDPPRSLEDSLQDGTKYVVVGDGDLPLFSEAEQAGSVIDRLVLGRGDIRLPAGTTFLREIYAAGSVLGRERSIYRAVLAKDSIALGRESRSLRWVHAENTITAAEGCRLHGRVSADGLLVVHDGCGFERLHAPRIEFRELPGPLSSDTAERDAPTVVLRAEDLANVIEEEAGRWLVEKALDIPANVLVEADLVVAGHCRIGKGAQLAGSIKSHGDLTLADGVVIEGSAVAGLSLHIATGCRIHGPALAEREIFVGAGTVVGTELEPTSVSGNHLYIAPGALVHGTVWAHVEGRVCQVDVTAFADSATGPLA